MRPRRRGPAPARNLAAPVPGRSPTSTEATTTATTPPTTTTHQSTGRTRPHRTPRNTRPYRSKSRPPPAPATTGSATQYARHQQPHDQPPRQETLASASPPKPNRPNDDPTQTFSIQNEAYHQTTPM